MSYGKKGFVLPWRLKRGVKSHHLSSLLSILKTVRIYRVAQLLCSSEELQQGDLTFFAAVRITRVDGCSPGTSTGCHRNSPRWGWFGKRIIRIVRGVLQNLIHIDPGGTSSLSSALRLFDKKQKMQKGSTLCCLALKQALPRA